MSLDGFISGSDNQMDWIFRFGGPNPVVDEIIASTGAVLVGRNSYDVGHQDNQPKETKEVHGGAWTGPQFVLTHRPPKDDSPNTFLSGDIENAVEVARSAAGNKNLLIIGADIARQVLLAGLVDEIVVHLAPLLLGSGIRFFDFPIDDYILLDPDEPSTAGVITNLRYRVVARE